MDNNALPDIDTEQPDIDNTPAWTSYAGLEWLALAEKEMNWQEAMDYCEAMGGRLPNITELRKLIINCPESTYGGACQVSDPDCLNYDCWASEYCRCDGSADSYSALEDEKNMSLWSSSSRIDLADVAWYVYFGYPSISWGEKLYDSHVRCVR